jgi:hypothetical protein
MGLYSKIAKEIIDRVKYHAGAGQMLAGLTFREYPEINIEGLKDFPNAMMFLPSVSESYHANIIADGNLRFNIAVSTLRSEGIPKLMEWVEKLLDAIETRRDGSGKVDTNLNGTTQPFTAQIANSFALDLSLTAQITITVSPKPMNRGTRRTS